MTTLYVQSPTLYLAGSGVIIGATSITLTSLTDIYRNVLTMADFGSLGFITLEPDTTNAEGATFTGVTANANGTYTLTGVKTMLAKSPYTQSSGLIRNHSGGTKVVVTDNVGFWDTFGNKNNTNTWGPIQTFTLLPISNGGNATTGTELVTYAQALAMATGTTNINRIVVAGNGGEVITAGQLLYLLVSDGEWYKCDADTAATVDNIILGIAQGAGSDGVAITSGVLLFGLDSNQTGLTNNTAYYASNTAGAISSSVGTVEVSVGISRSTTSLLFYPRYNQQLTEDQQDALAGDLGVPSATNLYVTAQGFQKNAEKYAADGGGSDTYTISLSPVPVAYSTGMIVVFRANTANTGAATLNANGLGAKTIVKGFSTTLADGDIGGSQLCVLIDQGANFQLINPNTPVSVGILFTNGTTTKDASDASTTQNIAHGLGRIPKYVKITALGNAVGSGTPNSNNFQAVTTYNGTTQSSYSTHARSTSPYGVTAATFTLNLAVTDGATQTGVVTFDATNIIVTWTKTGFPTGSYGMVWEATS